MGETWIDVFDPGEPLLRYECATAEELVTRRRASYVQTLEDRYIEKFPRSAAKIRKAVRRSANHHGREVFGARPDERMQQVRAQTSWKILALCSRRRPA